MDSLAVSTLAPTTLTAVNPLRPVKLADVPATNTLSVQDLTQTLFQQALQAVAASPVMDPASGMAQLAQSATASLLAALTAPQAAADSTAVPSATTNPTPVAGAVATATTAPPPSLPTSLVADLPLSQDVLAASATSDFAMQTALRFGAGVAGSANPAQQVSDLGTGLVRDAMAVIRAGNVQAQAGGPGPEAFQRAQATLDRILRDYQPVSAPPEVVGVDLLA